MKNYLNFKTLSYLLGLSVLMMVSSCDKDDEPTIGDPPSQADAQFTYQASATSDNIIMFSASNPNLDASWDFGNGNTATGSNVEATYPFAGTYEVTLTVQNAGGSASSSQQITIDQDDPTLIDNPLYELITGGGSKTWVVDSVSDGHFGVGPAPDHPDFDGYYPKWYAAKSLEKSGSGMYDDRYTFDLQGFGFDMETNGDVYVNTAHAGVAPFNDTTAVNVGDYTAQFSSQLGETWTLTEDADTTLTISGDAMIGYWAGTRTYKVVSLDSNQMVLGFQDAIDGDLFWYVTLIREGYQSNPPAPEPEYSLPLNFESEDPVFTVFGNSSYQIINNPDQSGINTSSRVLETTHGNETWAGLYVNLENKLDFSSQTSIKLKVWAPATGTFRLKLENQDDTNQFIEVDATINNANTWEELTFDLSGAASDFDRVVLFPGWGTSTADVYYVDDIVQE